MIKIVIADDHAMFRQGLKQLLNTVPDFTLSGEAANGKAALSIIEEQEPDVAILDISMPEMTGIQVARKLRRQESGTRCILLTMHKDPDLIREALVWGPMGYVLKENAFEELLEAVQAVMAGEVYLSHDLSLDTPPFSKQINDGLLTRREEEILKWIVSGLTNKEIANTLHISVKTVDTHRTRILRKLDVHNTAEMVRYAVKTGLV